MLPARALLSWEGPDEGSPCPHEQRGLHGSHVHRRLRAGSEDLLSLQTLNPDGLGEAQHRLGGHADSTGQCSNAARYPLPSMLPRPSVALAAGLGGGTGLGAPVAPSGQQPH